MRAANKAPGPGKYVGHEDCIRFLFLFFFSPESAWCFLPPLFLDPYWPPRNTRDNSCLFCIESSLESSTGMGHLENHLPLNSKGENLELGGHQSPCWFRVPAEIQTPLSWKRSQSIRGVLAGLEAQWRRQVLQDGARGAMNKAEGPVARGEIKRDRAYEASVVSGALASVRSDMSGSANTRVTRLYRSVVRVRPGS